jgi:predicted AlkP superfamily pyrophosphatase or phosphodiesterase
VSVSHRRVVIIGWDGLRPDLINAESTPFLHQWAGAGVQANRHFAAYPTETRVNAATLSTGCWPGRHGIVGNEFYWRPFGACPVNTGNFDDLCRLRELGPIVQAPSLAQRLAAARKGMAVISAGSPGSALMWDATQVGPVLNVWVDFGDPRTLSMREALGPAPARRTPNLDANRYVVRAYTDILLPDPDMAVCVLWLTEPDHSQHVCGLGSAEARQAFQDNDLLVAEIVAAIERRGEAGCTDVIVVSDHGFSTIERGDTELKQLVTERELSPELNDSILAVASYGIYLQPGADHLAVAKRLQEQPWCGIVLARSPDAAAALLPLSAAWGGRLNQRAPDLNVSPAWDARPNGNGVPGYTAFGSHIANHGSLSPFDLRSVFLARGPGFREGLVSDIPCGAVDLAPTVLHLLGVAPGDAPMDGRVLNELMKDGGQTLPVSREIITAGAGATRRALAIERIGQTQYLTGDVSGG